MLVRCAGERNSHTFENREYVGHLLIYRFPACLAALHHALLHSLFTGPIQADLVAFGIVQVGMTPSPRHHLRLLSENESRACVTLAEVVQLAHLEVKPHAIARDRRSRSGLMQGDGAVSAWRSQARID